MEGKAYRSLGVARRISSRETLPHEKYDEKRNENMKKIMKISINEMEKDVEEKIEALKNNQSEKII